MAGPGISKSTSRPSSDPRDWTGPALKALVWFHRWVGVCLCLMFATWFATGATMVFVAFPSLSDQARAASSEPVDAAQVRLDPRDGAARLGGAAGLRLVSRAGTAAYVGREAGRMAAVSAATGERLPVLSSDQALAIASRFGRTPALSVSGPLDYDQWIVHQQFDPWRPFYRVRLDDSAGTELYVSARTGEVRQRTERLERLANWLGSVVHWLYFVPLRRSFVAWDWTVWMLSLVGVATVAAGVWLGVTRTRKQMRSKRPGVSPFRGLLRWHHVIGLAACVFVIGWISSGWLSMDHGRLFSRGETPQSAQVRYAAGAAALRSPNLSLADVQGLARGATSVSFGRVDGCDVAAAAGPSARRTLASCAFGRFAGDQLPRRLISSALRAAWPGSAIASLAPARADSPYAKAESLPDGVLEARLAGGAPLRVFIDPASGEIQVVMDRSREAYAWAYYMLHTYNFPGLSDRPALRISILLVPLTLGFAFSVTGVLVGVRRLRAFRAAARPAVRS